MAGKHCPVARYLRRTKLTWLAMALLLTGPVPLKPVQAQSAAQTVQTMKQAGLPVDEIAAAVASTFNLGLSQVAGLLEAADYSATQVAGALNDSLGASAAEVASALRSAGFDAAQTAAALDDVFDRSTNQVAGLLEAAGYGATQVARALEDSLGAGAAAVASALRSAGFNAAQTAAALADVFDRNADQAAALLEDAGFPAEEVLGTMRTQFAASVEAARQIGEGVFDLSGDALRQALLAAGYAASAVNALFEQGVETGVAVVRRGVTIGNAVGDQAVRGGRTVIDRGARTSFVTLYDGYFRIVAARAEMRPLHARYREALSRVGIDAARVRVGHSRYLERTAGEVAMCDCNNVYFPNGRIVDYLATGRTLNTSELGWLLHELGHTDQCRSRGRAAFANRWFGELPPATLESIESGSPDPKTLHDAMPLEQEADVYRDRHLRAFETALSRISR